MKKYLILAVLVMVVIVGTAWVYFPIKKEIWIQWEVPGGYPILELVQYLDDNTTKIWQFGLREDGIVVWRNVNPDKNHPPTSE
ncbi:MAG: hypothetical protein KAX30_04395 [Candidatus Atribacteria bacterium]|nr:hypothetical protein [Candidatus Atribacteria bacterium]